MGLLANNDKFSLLAALSLLAGSLLLAPSPARGMSILPPRSLGELAQKSEAVILAEAGPSTCLRKGPLISTRTTFTALRGLSGRLHAGDRFTVEVPGGEVDGEGWLVPGSPSFVPSSVYLLCLDGGSDGIWRPRLLSYGALRRSLGADGVRLLFPLREAEGISKVHSQGGEAVEEIGTFLEDALLEHLESVLGGEVPWDITRARIQVEAPSERGAGGAIPQGCTFLTDDASGKHLRWQLFDGGGVARIRADARGDDSIPGGGFEYIQEAMNVWMSIPAVSFNLAFEGLSDVRVDCSTGTAKQEGLIVFNDPCEQLSDVLGIGGPHYYTTRTHVFDGIEWLTIFGWSVLVNNDIVKDGSGGGLIDLEEYRLFLAHEMGHGLGFAHPEDKAALMYGTCCNSIDDTDVKCAQYLYPGDPGNGRPAVEAAGYLDLTLSGNAVTLQGSAQDDGNPAGGSLEVAWRQICGPGGVTFAVTSSPRTLVTLPESGTYLLSLEGYDGRLLRADVVKVTASIFSLERAELSFQQGVGGYTGTVDTTLSQGVLLPGAGTSSELSVRGSGQKAQSLLRFKGIFGAGDDQVPPGAGIASAWIELSTLESGSGVAFHRMVTPWKDTDTWGTFGDDGIQAGVEAASTLDGITEVVDGVARVNVTESLQAWSTNPCEALGWALLPVGETNSTFGSSESSRPPRLTVKHSSVRRDALIDLGEEWRYFKGRTAPPREWKEPSFADDFWLTGSTGIGCGDGDDATVLDDMQGGYVSIFCRREFQVDDPGDIGRLILQIDYEDGFVAYLNGLEVARSESMGAPGTPVSHTTAAKPREAGRVEEYRLDAGGLREGTNVLAVEVHNSSLESLDVSFLPRLLADFVAVSDDAEWKYFVGASAPPGRWKEATFNDSLWSQGKAGIGFGRSEVRTEVTDMQGKYWTLFLRRSFQVADPGAARILRLALIYNDGAVVYFNGEEIARFNMPAGDVTFQSPAARPVDPIAGLEVGWVDLPPNLLVEGDNLLAVSLHNATLQSPDVSFLPVLMILEKASCGSSFQRGDASGDGSVDISDAVRILLYLFVGSVHVECEDAADTDDSGSLNVTDAVALLEFLFRGGPPPPSPGLECGPDPGDTLDLLGNCSTAACVE